jgi:hypothetical protein
MATPGDTSGAPKKTRRDRLEAIIRDRLELDEEWSAVNERPTFFGEIEKSRLGKFEDAFGQAVRAGCKWEVLLTCLDRYDIYNKQERVIQEALYDSDEEMLRPAEKVLESIGQPPKREKRISIAADLKAVAKIVETYESLLLELGQLKRPPGFLNLELKMTRPTADEVVPYLPKLLKWCGEVLSDDSLGNFRTVESVGRLIPCVYVDVVTPKARSEERRRLPLKPVADLLNIMEGNSPFRAYKQDQLREAYRRFQRQYPRVYRQLRAKMKDLHDTSKESPDGWQQLFAAEARRRSR